MIRKTTSYWHGEPLTSLTRSGLEQAAEDAITQLMSVAERERQQAIFDLAGVAFLGGALLAGLGALLGIGLAG